MYFKRIVLFYVFFSISIFPIYVNSSPALALAPAVSVIDNAVARVVLQRVAAKLGPNVAAGVAANDANFIRIAANDALYTKTMSAVNTSLNATNVVSIMGATALGVIGSPLWVSLAFSLGILAVGTWYTYGTFSVMQENNGSILIKPVPAPLTPPPVVPNKYYFNDFFIVSGVGVSLIPNDVYSNSYCSRVGNMPRDKIVYSDGCKLLAPANDVRQKAFDTYPFFYLSKDKKIVYLSSDVKSIWEVYVVDNGYKKYEKVNQEYYSWENTPFLNKDNKLGNVFSPGVILGLSNVDMFNDGTIWTVYQWSVKFPQSLTYTTSYPFINPLAVQNSFASFNSLNSSAIDLGHSNELTQLQALNIGKILQNASALPDYQGIPYSLTEPITKEETLTAGKINFKPYTESMTSPVPVEIPNPNPNPNPKPDDKLEINIGSPSGTLNFVDPSPVTALSILNPIFGLFSNLKTIKVNRESICPKWTVVVFGKPYFIESHCALFEKYREMIKLFMTAVFMFISTRKVLKA